MILFGFIFSLFIFIAIGASSTLVSRKTSDDYTTGSRSFPPLITALSAVATTNSGFMFIGLIGTTYVMGVSGAWLMIGWVLGDLMISFFTHKRIRRISGDKNFNTYNQVLADWILPHKPLVKKVAAVITLLFLGTYAAAQLNAGSKALNVLFGWDYSVGAIIGAVIVVIYCWAGGLRASVWTDAAQSVVMFTAMIIMMVIVAGQIGSPVELIGLLKDVDPELATLFPANMGGAFGPLLFIAGWFVAGFGIVGQPHIMIRFMSVNSTQSVARTRLYYYIWYSLFSVLSVFVGLYARILIPDTASFDSELALPSIAKDLLPGFWAGVVLAGLFAATMSTADSQILSCSASINHDLLPKHQKKPIYDKMATLGLTVLILIIALTSNQSVFSLVAMAWSVLSVAFGPLIILYAFGQKPSEAGAIITMACGLIALFIWRHFGYNADVYEVLPGMAASFIGYGLYWAGTRIPQWRQA